MRQLYTDIIVGGGANLDNNPGIRRDPEQVHFAGNHSKSTIEYAKGLYQRLDSYFQEQGIKAKVTVNAYFKDGQPTLAVTAYSSNGDGESLMGKAKSQIINSLNGLPANTSFEGSRAEITFVPEEDNATPTIESSKPTEIEHRPVINNTNNKDTFLNTFKNLKGFVDFLEKKGYELHWNNKHPAAVRVRIIDPSKKTTEPLDPPMSDTNGQIGTISFGRNGLIIDINNGDKYKEIGDFIRHDETITIVSDNKYTDSQRIEMDIR